MYLYRVVYERHTLLVVVDVADMFTISLHLMHCVGYGLVAYVQGGLGATF